MFDQLLGSFLGSPQSQQAMQALQARGYPPDQAQSLLQAAVPGAAAGMANMTAGHAEPALGLFNIFGGHSGMEFLTGAVTGLLRGDGFFGSFKDGAVGMLAGHMGEYIAQRTGMNQRLAGEAAAVVAPFISHYAHEKLSEHPAVVAQHGPSPHHHHHHHHHE